jgi:hypothetical protein
MSVETTSEIRKSDLFAKLLEVYTLLSDSKGIVEDMFDPSTWGNNLWKEKFIEDTYILDGKISAAMHKK